MATRSAPPARIAENKKAAFNYFFEERLEAGMVLEGWEVKAIREGKVQTMILPSDFKGIVTTQVK